MSYSTILIIRRNKLNNFKNLDLTSLIKKIEISNLKIDTCIIDIKYEYKKNKIENRIQKIIIFGLDEKLKLLDERKIN